MKMSGWMLIVLGVAIFIYAVSSSTTVPTAGVGGFGGEVVNLDLQQRQLIASVSGLTLFLTGAIVAAIGTLADRIAPLPSGRTAEPGLASSLPTTSSPPDDDDDTYLGTRERMQKYGIEADGKAYAVDGRSFYQLSGAINYVRRSRGWPERPA